MPEDPGPVVVLDAWPVIEHYDGNDPAASEVRHLLRRPYGPRPVINAVNFAEICYSLANRYGTNAAERESQTLQAVLRIEPPGSRTALVASWIKHTYEMSLGDTFAAATAIRHGVELWTGDAELLCPDRVWAVHDLRHPDKLATPTPRRRPGRLEHLDEPQLGAFIAAPLARLHPRRLGPAIEHS